MCSFVVVTQCLACTLSCWQMKFLLKLPGELSSGCVSCGLPDMQSEQLTALFCMTVNCNLMPWVYIVSSLSLVLSILLCVNMIEWLKHLGLTTGNIKNNMPCHANLSRSWRQQGSNLEGQLGVYFIQSGGNLERTWP